MDQQAMELPAGYTADPQEAQKEAQEAEQRRMMIDQILTPEARARLVNVGMVKKEKARAIEDMLISMAQKGQLQGRVTENEFKVMLEKVSAQMEKKTKVTIQRRKYFDDDDDDNDEDLR